MTPADGGWTFEDNLPLGAAYKIDEAGWVDGDTISADDVTWEQGYNHTIDEEYGYDKLVEDVSPQF